MYVYVSFKATVSTHLTSCLTSGQQNGQYFIWLTFGDHQFRVRIFISTTVTYELDKEGEDILCLPPTTDTKSYYFIEGHSYSRREGWLSKLPGVSVLDLKQ